MAEEYPLLNGYTPSWCDVSTVINIAGGGTFKDIGYKELNWKASLSVGTQEGQSGGIPIAQTQGRVTYEASAIFYAGAFNRLLAQLAPLAPRRGNQARISLVRFSIVIFHTPFGSTDILHDEIRGGRVGSMEGKEAESDDPIVTPVDLHPMQCVRVLPDNTEIVLL